MRAKILIFLTTILVCAVTWILTAKQEVRYDCVDCNVILISIDTLRADHLGCYGYPRPTSPSVDRFAEDAVQFQWAIAHAPSTEPSHGAIFTSMLPAHHGGWRAKRQPISSDAVMMAEIFKGAGYKTVSYNGGGQVSKNFGFDRGFDVYDSSSGDFNEKVDKAQEWIQQNGEDKFYMFLHTYQVHAPYTPEKQYLDLFDGDYSGDLGPTISNRLLIDIHEGTVRPSAADVQHIVNTYDGEIRSMDDAFGRLSAFLTQQGILDNTIVLFTSDHGEEFGEHGEVGRHSHALYDELLHVPLLMHFPMQKFGGTKVDQQVRGIDILPTLTEILAIEPLEQFQGSSLVSLLGGRDNDPRPAVSQVDLAQPHPPTSIRTASEKLILGSPKSVDDALSQAYQYYRLSEDPAEVENLFDSPGSGESILALEQELRALLAGPGVEPANQPIEIDETTQQQLKALGYTD
jgi:arylsulfatase A-like enzyme